MQTSFFHQSCLAPVCLGVGGIERERKRLFLPAPLPSQRCFSENVGVLLSPLFPYHPPDSLPHLRVPQALLWGRNSFTGGRDLLRVTSGSGTRGSGSQLGARLAACDPHPCSVLGGVTSARDPGESSEWPFVLSALSFSSPRGVGCYQGVCVAFSDPWGTHSFSNWGE